MFDPHFWQSTHNPNPWWFNPWLMSPNFKTCPIKSVKTYDISIIYSIISDSSWLKYLKKKNSIYLCTCWWLVGGWNMFNSIYPECHNPNWRTPSCFRGVGQPPTRWKNPWWSQWYPWKIPYKSTISSWWNRKRRPGGQFQWSRGGWRLLSKAGAVAAFCGGGVPMTKRKARYVSSGYD